MKRTAILGLTLAFTFATGLMVVVAEDRKTNELLEAALTKETIEGDLKGAIALYEQAVKEAGSNRALAAKAQLRLASAYQKQGNEQAREVYERVVRDYADVPEAASEARSRLSTLPGTGGVPSPNDPDALGKFIKIDAALTKVDAILSNLENPSLRQITLFDRQGKVLGTVGDPGPAGTMTISPDGKRVALVRNGSILVFDVKTQSFITLTPGPVDAQPTWSADGKRIAFEVRAILRGSGRQPGVHIKASDGTGTDELVASLTGITLVGWSPDGRYLTYQQNGPTTKADLWVLPLNGERRPMPILATPASENGLRISPDGRYMSYRVIDGDRTDIYVSPFNPSATPDPTRPIERWKVSTGPLPAVAGVRWRADGKELYYIDVNGGVTAVEVTTTPSFRAGTPRVLFRVPDAFRYAPNQTAGFSDVTADGQIFALMVPR